MRAMGGKEVVQYWRGSSALRGGSKNGLILADLGSNYVFDHEESLLYSWEEMVLQGH